MNKFIALALDEFSVRRMQWRCFRSGAGAPYGATNPGTEPPTHQALIAQQRVTPPVVDWPPSRCSALQIAVHLPVCQLRTFVDWHSEPNAETLIVWHHGLAEIPHDFIPSRVRANCQTARRADWIIVKAPGHATADDVWRVLMADRERYWSIALSSVALLDAIAKAQRGHYQRIICVGLSWGGLVALTNAAHYQSYDLYIPILAGPDLADFVFRSYFGRVVDRRFRQREQESEWFGEYWSLQPKLAPHSPALKIKPMLARHDRYARLDVQGAAYASLGIKDIAMIDNGHFGACFSFKTMARHIDDALG